MNKRITLALLTVVVALGLSGCGGLAQKAKSLSTRGGSDVMNEVGVAEKSGTSLPPATALPVRKMR
jgi:hypothetical protein